jgi:hypothetical protein
VGLSTELLGRNVDLYTARLYFDACLKRTAKLTAKFGLGTQIVDDIKEYLAPSAIRSKNSQHFVNGIIKVIGNTERTMTVREKEAIREFKKESKTVILESETVEDEDDMVEESVDEEVARLKTIAEANGSNYDNVSWIPSTTCEVERFFSQCKLNHSDKRIALTNDNLEMIMFLKCHNWTMELVEKALKADE